MRKDAQARARDQRKDARGRARTRGDAARTYGDAQGRAGFLSGSKLRTSRDESRDERGQAGTSTQGRAGTSGTNGDERGRGGGGGVRRVRRAEFLFEHGVSLSGPRWTRGTRCALRFSGCERAGEVVLLVGCPSWAACDGAIPRKVVW